MLLVFFIVAVVFYLLVLFVVSDVIYFHDLKKYLSCEPRGRSMHALNDVH